MLPDALVHVDNLPTASDRTQKQGYMLLLEVGDQTAKHVCLPAAIRILNGKEPHEVIVADKNDQDAFTAALDRYRKDITEQIRNEPDPRSRLKLIAIREATHRVVVHVDSECDVIRGLGDRDKLYLVGHSEAGVDGILYRFGDGHSLMTPQAIAEALKDAELDAGFRDLRLFVCEGACPPPGGGASTAERLVLALGSLGFRNVELSAYRGNIGIWDASGNAFEDGKHHNAVWLGDTRVRASDVRQTFRYHPAADHLSPR